MRKQTHFVENGCNYAAFDYELTINNLLILLTKTCL